ncbi:MAG: response regulator [Candidatus Azobacteroides sp.]|nr:response regulator [Candidatus Azobacteroides sp.]
MSITSTFEYLIPKAMKRLTFTLVFLIIFLSFTHASYFRSYQVEDGLSHNSVWAVMQDSKGFLWFGTNDGLNRFDGKAFRIFKEDQEDSLSIGNNFIHCLKEDSQRRFLVGTKEGLYLYHADFENFTHIDLLNSPDKKASINAIMEDPDGNIWVACNGQGLIILNPDLSIKKHYIHHKEKEHSLPTNYIWCVEKDYNGGIWLGTAGEGLVFFDPKSEHFTRMKEDHRIRITDPTIFSIYCDIDHNIWIGTLSEGLYKYNYRSGNVSNYMQQTAFSIKSIIEFSDRELIMGSDKGLIKFERSLETYELINEEASFDNLTDKSIFSITRDKEGAFWIGTYFGGVNYYSPSINKFFYYGTSHNETTRDIVSSFVEDTNGNIWVSTHNHGLSAFNSRNKKLNIPRYDIGYHDIQALLLDGENLYISLYGKGISILNTRTGNIAKLPDSAFSTMTFTSIYKTSGNKIIFGSEEGAFVLNKETNKLERMERLAGIPIKGMAEDYNGALWFAAHKYGLIRLNSDNRWESFTNHPDDPESLRVNNVNCVFQDAKFRIWVGTEGGGLSLFNQKKNGFDVILNEKSGLPSNIIYAILDDTDGNIWVTTGGGLVKINPDTKEIKTFGYIDDFQKIRYNLRCALRASDNRLYFGGTNGFIAFNPKEITDNAEKPEIIITGFQIFNKEVLPEVGSTLLSKAITQTEAITLEYNQSSFSFDFVALSYLSPTHNQYAYKLEGFDTDWNYIDNNNKAYYMNIPPGEYVFRVKGSNNDGIWSEEDATIRIKIKPPFWKSPWMMVLYVLIVLLTCYYLVKRYNKRINTKNQEKLYKYQIEKEKENYESKINFFTNIAHEIRTPLSLIVAPLENILISGDGNNKTRNNLQIIKHNSNRLLELVNQLLDFRKIEDDMFHFNFRQQDIIHIVQDVYNQYCQQANEINMVLNVSREPILCIIDSEAIYKIVSNLVSNAAKYAKKEIEINVSTREESLLISVKDDGIGLDKMYQEKIFEPFFQVQDNGNYLRTGSGLGLSLSQSLAVKHGGKISVESTYGSGAVFTLTIPLVIHPSQETVTQDLRTEEKEEIPSYLPVSDSGLKVLIVEDNNELRLFIVDCLKETYAICEAGNGKEALEIIERENIDVIVSDIIMPEMDGLELAKQIKTNPAYSHIPLILLSAKTDTPTKIEGLNKGADVYLEKPFSIEQLKAQINSIIENRNHIRNNFIQSPLQYFKQNTENTENAEFVEKLNSIILENMSDEKFSIDNLSEQFHISRSNFHKKLKNITGMTPNDYIKLIRLNKSAQMLSTGRYKINEVCYLVGFNTPSYFSKCFYEQFGKLPKDFIQQE